jgi:hypothetical protein
MKKYFIIFMGLLFSSLFAQMEKQAPQQPSLNYNSTARYLEDRNLTGFITTNFTYCKAVQEGLSIGITILNENVVIFSMPFHYEPGFKVGFGMTYGHDDWETFAEYTYYRFHNKLHQGASSDEYILDATGDWKLHIDQLDVNLARSFYVGQSFIIKPSMGLRALWTKQRLIATSDTLDIEEQDTSSFILTTLSKSWALGPFVSVDAQFNTCKYFYLLGKALLADLYTQYKVNNTFESNFITDFSSNITLKPLRPMLELALGVGSGSYFNQDKCHWDLNLAYTFNCYWNQNVLNAPSSEYDIYFNQNNEDLYLHGLNAQLRFDF